MNFYFYDLETSGFSPFHDRIMQFGGCRLNKDLELVGEPEEFYIKLSDDILPLPTAVLTHKILPQVANLEGVSEYQLIKWLQENVYQPETVYIGYNNFTFDNLFMRWLHWRNFVHPSPMNQAGQSLDIYQLFSLAFDLRPQALNWPDADQRGRVSLKLSSLAEANQIQIEDAHSAMGDVKITIALLRLLVQNQPKLWQHFLELLKADFVKSIIGSQQPFIYTHHHHLASGSRTSLAVVLAEHPTQADCFISYDLRADCRPWQKLSVHELSLKLNQPRFQKSSELPPFSLINIQQAPPVAPLSVLDKDAQKRLKLHQAMTSQNLQNLRLPAFAKRVQDAYLQLNQDSRTPTSMEAKLAKKTLSKAELEHCRKVAQTDPADLSQLSVQGDLSFLQFLYQARNFPKTLKTDQIIAWDQYKKKIFYEQKPSVLNRFQYQIKKCFSEVKDQPEAVNMLEELQLYVSNILPDVTEADPF